MARKRRSTTEQEQSSSKSTTTSHHQLGNYLLQSSAGAIPASHAQIPTNIWMVSPVTANANTQQQVMSGDPIWTFPPVNNSVSGNPMNTTMIPTTLTTAMMFKIWNAWFAWVHSETARSGGAYQNVVTDSQWRRRREGGIRERERERNQREIYFVFFGKFT